MASTVRILTYLMFSAILVAALSVQAQESRRPFEPRVAGAASLQARYSRISSAGIINEGDSKVRLERIPLLELRSTAPGVGKVQIRMTTRWNKRWPSMLGDSSSLPRPIALLRGTVKANGKTYPASMSLLTRIDGRGVGEIAFVAPTRRSKKMKTFTLTISLGDSAAHVRRPSMAAFDGKKCGSLERAADTVLVGPGVAAGTVTAKPKRILELATEADFEFTLRARSRGYDPNDLIASIVNKAESIYTSGLNTEIDIVSQHAFTFARPELSSSSSYTLLTNFSSYTNLFKQLEYADLYHLFSGKILDESIVGLSNVGVVCTYQGFAYGLTQFLEFSGSDLSHLVFAHEIGHNFGAKHDDASGVSLMNSSLDPYHLPIEFSAISKKQIEEHLSHYSGCLASEGPARPVLNITLRADVSDLGNIHADIILANSQGGFADPSLIEIMGRELGSTEPFVTLVRTPEPSWGASFSKFSPGEYIARLYPNTEITSKVFVVLDPQMAISLAKKKSTLVGKLQTIGKFQRAKVILFRTRKGRAGEVLTRVAAARTKRNGSFVFDVQEAGRYKARWIYPRSDAFVESKVVTLRE
jgi:hypothetical protein